MNYLEYLFNDSNKRYTCDRCKKVCLLGDLILHIDAESDIDDRVVYRVCKPCQRDMRIEDVIGSSEEG